MKIDLYNLKKGIMFVPIIEYLAYQIVEQIRVKNNLLLTVTIRKNFFTILFFNL